MHSSIHVSGRSRLAVHRKFILLNLLVVYMQSGRSRLGNFGLVQFTDKTGELVRTRLKVGQELLFHNVMDPVAIRVHDAESWDLSLLASRCGMLLAATYCLNHSLFNV